MIISLYNINLEQMKLTLTTLQSTLYLLAPFIIVCYFILFSIINADVKGFVYLLGLITCTILTVFIGNGIVGKNNKQEQTNLCSLITINHIAGVSNVPLSITIYCFTAAYLVYTMSATNYVMPNFVPLLFFSILIIGDMVWLSSNNCFSSENIIAAFAISTLLGIGWGYIINKTENRSLQYLTGDDTICTMPKKQTFKCKTGTVPSK